MTLQTLFQPHILCFSTQKNPPEFSLNHFGAGWLYW